MRCAVAISCVLGMIKLAVAAAPATKPATTTSALALPELKGITIQTGAISPQQAFEELSTQSDVPFAVKSADVWLRAGPGSIGVDLKDAPFWVAMKTLCQLTNLIPQRSEENAEEIVLAPSEHNWLWGKNAPTCPTSVATFVIGNISESRQIKLHRPQKIDRSLNLTIDAFVDPRLHVVNVQFPEKLAAIDDRGRTLEHVNPRTRASNDRGNWVWHCYATLKPAAGAGAAADQPADRLALLRGEATMMIASRSESWEIADLARATAAKPQTHKVLGFDVTFRKASASADGGEFTIELAATAGDRPGEQFREFADSLREWLSNARITDASGAELTMRSSSSGRSDKDFEMSGRFHSRQEGGGGKVNGPVKMTWTVPTETREITVPFEFNELPLP